MLGLASCMLRDRLTAISCSVFFRFVARRSGIAALAPKWDVRLIFAL